MHRGGAGYQAAYAVYPAENYGIGSKPMPPRKDDEAAAEAADDGGRAGGAPALLLANKVARRKRRYAQEGMRRTAEALLLVARHGHPHVLLAQHGPGQFRLPGGRVRPGEDDVDALRRKLAKQLSPDDPSLAHAWEVAGDALVGAWWRTGWETDAGAALYPYLPPHATRPKEALRLFLVALPERGFFAVPRDRRLVAVPLFELHDNPARYGPVLAAVPSMLSRFRLNVVAATAAPPGGVGGAAAGAVGGGGGGAQPQDFDPYIA
jgi:cleavage and polyadenylation specificity factor subunit 5